MSPHFSPLATCSNRAGNRYLTAAAPPVLLSSGSGCSATCCLCGATRGSPPTGWILADPERPRTESGGCRRRRPHPRRSSGRGGLRWWCGWACCSWPRLKRPKTHFSVQKQQQNGILNLDLLVKTYGFQSKICENPSPPPGFPELLAQMKSGQDRRSYWRGKQEGTHPKLSILSPTDAHTPTQGRKGTHAYASKSPLLMASISCSVILMISCLRAVREGRKGRSPSQISP